MRSWSSRSGDLPETGDDAALRRFVEASRRAEIVALVNSADDEASLGEVVAGELCEAFDAEYAFVLGARSPSAAHVVGAVGFGAVDSPPELLLDDARASGALDGGRAQVHAGENLLGVGARRLAVAGFAGEDGACAALGVARRYEQDFEASELALLEAVATSVGHALERTWLSGERDRHAAQQAALARAARLLNASLERDEVLSTLCHEVCVALGADAVVVSLTDGDRLVVAAQTDVVAPSLGTGEAAEGLAADAFTAGATRAFTGDGVITPPPGGSLQAALAVPLRRRGPIDGVLELRWREPRWLDDTDVELASAFAELAGGACRNAEEHAAARRAATLDSLTGCLNHAALQIRLREEISRAERGAEPFTMVLVDLDRFKGVNERHGHLAGDTVLRSAGELLRSAVRTHDQVARFGGDEFALLLPATNAVVAEGIVARTLDLLATAPMPASEGLTAAAGIACWGWGEQATDVLDRADGALREAKRTDGGNRLTVAAAPAAGALPPGQSASHEGTRAERISQPRPRDQRLAIAGEIGAKLSRLLDPLTISETAAADIHRGLGYERCALVVLRGDVALELARAEGGGAHATDPPEARDAASPVTRCLRERRPVLVADAERDPVFAGSTLPGLRSWLAVPVYSGPSVWGAIEVAAEAPSAFEPADARLVQAIADHVGAALRTAELYHELEETYVGTAAALAAALEAKDDYTAEHAQSIADMAVTVGEEIGLDERSLRDLRYGAIFHDIGKIAVPDAILHKPGRLTEAEFEIVKRHPITGEQILAPVPFLTDVRRIVRHDHERWDGGGYPDGLSEDQIPVGARIVFVVDAYHAMISDRPYRTGMPDAEAREELREHAGSQFDPRVVEAFLRVLDRQPDVP